MSEKEVVFDGDIRKALADVSTGARLLCPKCRAQLIIAANPQAANASGVHPGIHCPVDQRHVNVLFNLSSSRRLLDGIGE